MANPFIYNTKEEAQQQIKVWGEEPKYYFILEEPKIFKHLFKDTYYTENIKHILQQDENEIPIKWTTPKKEITELKRDCKGEIYLITYKPDEPTEQQIYKILQEQLNNKEKDKLNNYTQEAQPQELTQPQETHQEEAQTQETQPQETHPQEEPEQTSDTETTTTENTEKTATTEPDDTIFIIPDITKSKKESDEILNLDINTEKDLSCYKELTSKELADNTARKDQILKRIAEHNLNNDTAKLDFYKHKINKPEGEIVELSGIFCDNLILSGLTTTSRTKGKKCEDCGQSNTASSIPFNFS